MATPQLVLPAATRRQLLVGATALAATGLTAGRASAGTVAAPAAPAAPAYLASNASAAAQSARVHGWATDTWRSLVAMTDPKTGLPADNIAESLAAGDRRGYTSPTNIGGYLWSAVVARELGIISRAECTKRLVQTLNTLLRDGAPRAERHVLQLVRRGHRRVAHDLARPTAAGSTRSSPASTTAGSVRRSGRR